MIAMRSLPFILPLVMAAQFVPPDVNDLLNGDTLNGGMFGYDLAMTDGSLNDTYLIVGKPWDASAYIYSSPSPVRTYTSAGIPIPVPPPTWSLRSQIYDTGNYTWTLGYYNNYAPATPAANSYALSYYGHSVDISNDGQFVAVGIPGQGRTDAANYSLETGGSYEAVIGYSSMIGEVRLYPTTGSNGGFSVNNYTAIRRNPAVPGHFFKNKFGHQVKFSKDSQFLFVVANGGWDGTRAYYDGAASGCADPNWQNEAMNPSRNMDGVGTHVYQRVNGVFTYLNFYPTSSPIPLGQQGITLTTQGTGNHVTFSVRTFLQNTDSTATSGAVDFYYYNPTSSPPGFQKKTTIAKTPITPTTPASGSWQNEDWFGQSISAEYDAASDQLQMAISAPRDGTVLYTYFAPNYTTSTFTGFTPNQILSNEFATSRSYYGGTVKFSSDANFIFVADGATVTGRGMVHVYMKRAGYVALGYENVAIAALPPGIISSTSLNALDHVYDRVYTFVQNSADFAFSQSAAYTTANFTQSSFGKAIASNLNWVVIGAPVSELVHSFRAPVAYKLVVNATTSTNQTTVVVTTPPATGTSSKSALLYGIIGGLGVCIIALPAAFLGLRRRHRKELIARLEAQKALAALNANPWENPAAGAGSAEMEMQSSNARLV